MKWNKLKKVFICMMAMLVVSIVFCNIYAAINEDYYTQNQGAFKVQDTGDQLDKKTAASVLLDAIGILVYALASLGEWLLGIIFQAATGGDAANNIFPWADAILFNAIPFLDINFLNPHPDGSVVGLIVDVIKVIYGTAFGLAISFFSIAVLIMGVKLAISTIASEKAKYKQAIWDWLSGLVLLFTIHFFISFIFYLNEELVIIAEDIASKQINTKGKDVINISQNSESNEDIITAFVTSQYGIGGANSTLDNLKNLWTSEVSGDNQEKLNNLLQEENIAVASAILKNDKMLEYGLGVGWANETGGFEMSDFWTSADTLRVDFVIQACTIINTYKADGYTPEKFNEVCDKQIEQLTKGSSTYKSYAGDDLAILDPWNTRYGRIFMYGNGRFTSFSHGGSF